MANGDAVVGILNGFLSGIKEGMMYNKQLDFKEKELRAQQSQFGQSLNLKKEELKNQKAQNVTTKEDQKLSRITLAINTLDTGDKAIMDARNTLQNNLASFDPEDKSEEKQRIVQQITDYDKQLAKRIPLRERLEAELGAGYMVKDNPVANSVAKTEGGAELISSIAAIQPKEGYGAAAVKAKALFSQLYTMPDGEEKTVLMGELKSRLEASKQYDVQKEINIGAQEVQESIAPELSQGKPLARKTPKPLTNKPAAERQIYITPLMRR